MAGRFCSECKAILRTKKRSGGFLFVCPRCGAEYIEKEMDSDRQFPIPGPAPAGEGERPPVNGRDVNGRIRDIPQFGADSLRAVVREGRVPGRKGNTGENRHERTGSPDEGKGGGFKKNPEFPLFPYGTIREGQIGFMRDCKKAFEKRCHLVSYAPTGIGKTVAALVPALRVGLAMNKTVLFLTSKQSQHKIAVETLRSIYEGSRKLRTLISRSPHRAVVEANARSKGDNLIVVDVISKQDMCPRDFAGEYHAVFNEFCKLEKKMRTCPYLGSDSVETFRKIEGGILHVEELTDIAVSSMMCPHKAALDVACYAHVIICDYNYLFSDMTEVMLDKLGLGFGDIIAIVDEAHNLPDRIRAHLSGDMTLHRMSDALSELQEIDPQLHHFVSGMRESLTEIFSAIESDTEMIVPKEALIDRVEAVLLSTLDGPRSFKDFYESLIEEGEKRLDAGKGSNSVLHLGEFLQIWDQSLPGTVRFGSAKGRVKLCYRLLDPSVIAEPIFRQLHSAVIMSGTLFPPRMYADVLGMEPRRTVLREYLSPFPRENRPVYVCKDVTTKYSSRTPDMYTKMADWIRNLAGTFCGNVAVFFPSYSLLQDIEMELMESRPAKQIIVEEKGMNKVEKDILFTKLDRLQYMGGGILLAVQGGSLSEGIDYPGRLLSMVIVVGIPMAPPSLEVDLLVSYFRKLFGGSRGYEYSYMLPAISRVLQAAGRCIRSEKDRGVVVLMDRRFLQGNFSKHFPADFSPRRSARMMEEIEKFFREGD